MRLELLLVFLSGKVVNTYATVIQRWLHLAVSCEETLRPLLVYVEALQPRRDCQGRTMLQSREDPRHSWNIVYGR